MKYLFAFPFLVFSMNASAETIKSDCRFTDFFTIRSAISNNKIVEGKKFKFAALQLLNDEAAPRCSAIVNLDNLAGIPGDKSTVFELEGSGVAFRVVIIESVERHSNEVSIEKL